MYQKQSKEISEHHSNNNSVFNNNIMSGSIIDPQYIFDIGNKTIQTTISGLSQVPLMIVYNGNVVLPKGFYIANSNPNLPITFDPLIINNDEWMPPKTQTIIVPFKVIGQVSLSVIQIPISFVTPNGSPIQIIPINISIIPDMIPPSSLAPQEPIQPSQPVAADVPYEPSEEEMKKKINELDRKCDANSIFADNDIRDAILKAKGDINKAQEILFD